MYRGFVSVLSGFQTRQPGTKRIAKLTLHFPESLTADFSAISGSGHEINPALDASNASRAIGEANGGPTDQAKEQGRVINAGRGGPLFCECDFAPSPLRRPRLDFRILSFDTDFAHSCYKFAILLALSASLVRLNRGPARLF